MERLISMLGRPFGLRFAPDNHVLPVLRLGQYHRVGGPGFFRIVPLLERTMPPVKTSLHVGDFVFEDVLSRENIPLRVRLTVLFTFNPAAAPKSAAAVLVRGGDQLLQIIIRDYASQGLRHLVSRFKAEELSGGIARSIIERDLTHFLSAEMRTLGIAPLRQGGLLLKEMIGPEKFTLAMLNVKRYEATLQLLAHYRELSLVEHAILAEFLIGLADREGDLALMSPLEIMPQFNLKYTQRARQRNGR